MSYFDQIGSSNFSFAKPESNHPVGNLFTLLGESNRYISGTYNALLRRPELFGENAITLMYALDVGQSFKKEALYLMYRGFLNKPPTTTESNIIFNWATYLKQFNTFINFEPIFSKLNDVIKCWLNGQKTINWKGHSVPIHMFKPILYNSNGVNLIEVLPYIAYIFEYHIYGLPFQFSDVYSSSSLKNYLTSLENWFAQHYLKLNKFAETNDDISDDEWKDFYDRMLKVEEIVRIRNEEINKTKGVLERMISDQQSLSDRDLAEKFDLILTKLIEISIEESAFNIIFKKVPTFDSQYCDVSELINLTSFYMNDQNKGFIIDKNNYYKYIQTNESFQRIREELNISKLNFGLHQILGTFHTPFAKGDQINEIFKGMLANKFISKRQDDFLDDCQMHITVSDLDIENLYENILKMFVNGVWNSESTEMRIILDGLKNDQFVSAYINDLFALHQTLQLIYGNTTQVIVTSVYLVSLLNEWLAYHCENQRKMSDFNPFIYMKNTKLENERVIKIQNMMYSYMFLHNRNYIEFVNSVNDYFYKIRIEKPTIIQPYIQTLEDDARIFAIGGVETYKYSKYSNPIIRGFGFTSNVESISPEVYVFHEFTKGITNESVFELLSEKKLDLGSKIQTVITAIKKIPSPNRLNKYVFEKVGSGMNNTIVSYKFRTISEIAELTCKNNNGKQMSVLEYLIGKSFNRSGIKTVDEFIRVKTINIDGDGSLSNEVYGSTINGFEYKGKFIDLSENAVGITKQFPIYSPAARVLARNVSITRPDNKRLETVISFDDINQENNVFWIFTTVRKPMSFPYVKLEKSGYKPDDGTYMFTDRIQPIPK